MRNDVCSAPDCREALPPGVEICPKCRGTIAGVIHRTAEHYVETATFRRELALLREPGGEKRAKRPKRARKPDDGAEQ